jgi:ADP-ribose pyrophosphatase YjhB (NUDIX family)
MSGPHDTPAPPRLAVSAAIFDDRRLLLVRRARQPAKGLYTLPGGRVEYGEALHQALIREIREETALEIAIVGLAGWREVLPAMAGGGHFVILSFAARRTGGELVLNEELATAEWRAPDAVAQLPTTEGLAEIVAAARRLVGI